MCRVIRHDGSIGGHVISVDIDMGQAERMPEFVLQRRLKVHITRQFPGGNVHHSTAGIDPAVEGTTTPFRKAIFRIHQQNAERMGTIESCEIQMIQQLDDDIRSPSFRWRSIEIQRSFPCNHQDGRLGQFKCVAS